MDMFDKIVRGAPKRGGTRKIRGYEARERLLALFRCYWVGFSSI
jgi:hypothetical protein